MLTAPQTTQPRSQIVDTRTHEPRRAFVDPTKDFYSDNNPRQQGQSLVLVRPYP